MLKLSCQEAQSLLDAFHDNELDGVNSLAVQEHLDECPDTAVGNGAGSARSRNLSQG
jgi:predicted anti-sigma-YlaC factor YlaD